MSLTTLSAIVGGAAKNIIVAADTSGNLAPAHLIVDTTGSAIAVAQDGTDATGIAAPAGAAGIRGWLSGIYARLNATLAVSVASLPLPAGAATEAALASIDAKLALLLAAEQPYQGVVPMVVGTAVAAQRAVRIICSSAGTVSLTYLDGSIDVIPVNVGLSYIVGAVIAINTAGTTATAIYANLK